MNLLLSLPDFAHLVGLHAAHVPVPLNQGYNSDVWIIPEISVVLKHLGGKKHLELTNPQATELGMQMDCYRQLLLERGVRVPQTLRWLVVPDAESDSADLITVEPYTGPDAETLIRDLDGITEQVVTLGILTAIEPFLGQGLFVQNVGLDPKTSNFTLGSDEGLCYVDFIPPRYQKDDGVYLVEYPNITEPKQLEFWQWKYFTSQGILTIALYQLGRVRPDLFQSIKQNAIAFLRERDYNQETGYLELLEFVNTESVQRITNPMQLRLVMCELASRRHISPSVVEQFFQLTHFEGELPKQELKDAQRILMDCV